MIVTTDSFMETQTPSAFSSKSILFKIKDGPLRFLYSKCQSTRNLLPIQPQNMQFFFFIDFSSEAVMEMESHTVRCGVITQSICPRIHWECDAAVPVLQDTGKG